MFDVLNDVEEADNDLKRAESTLSTEQKAPSLTTLELNASGEKRHMEAKEQSDKESLTQSISNGHQQLEESKEPLKPQLTLAKGSLPSQKSSAIVRKKPSGETYLDYVKRNQV